MDNVITIKEAIGKIKSGMTLGLSGFSYMNPPMAFVRELIKKRINDLTIVSGPTSGIETDILIGAGCVKKVITACVSFEKIASVAPNFRDAAEKSKIEIWECDECIWHMALKAGIYDIPYILWRGGIGSSIPELNKDIKEVFVDGRHYLKIPPVKIDVSLIHCGYADVCGNVQHPKNIFLGRTFSESVLASASRQAICSVENIVDNSAIMKSPERTVIRNAFVVEATYGAHPGASNGYYIPDLEHYKEYTKFCREGKFEGYLEKYVFNVESHEEYIGLIGKYNLEKLRLEEK